jgi:hypothetical protein
MDWGCGAAWLIARGGRTMYRRWRVGGSWRWRWGILRKWVVGWRPRWIIDWLLWVNRRGVWISQKLENIRDWRQSKGRCSPSIIFSIESRRVVICPRVGLVHQRRCVLPLPDRARGAVLTCKRRSRRCNVYVQRNYQEKRPGESFQRLCHYAFIQGIQRVWCRVGVGV